MNKIAVVAILISPLAACSQSYSPVTQAALTVHGVTDARAAEEINEFLGSRGYKTRTSSSSPDDHRWYERNNEAFVEIEANANHCISFIALVQSGSADFVAAKTISEEFLSHFGQEWSIKRDQVCS